MVVHRSDWSALGVFNIIIMKSVRALLLNRTAASPCGIKLREYIIMIMYSTVNMVKSLFLL